MQKSKTSDIQKSIKVGDVNIWERIVHPINTYNPTGKHGNLILKMSDLVHDIELCSAEILDKNRFQSVGFLLNVNNPIDIPFGTKLKYTCKVKEINKDKITFSAVISDAFNDTTFATGEHIRAVIGLME